MSELQEATPELIQRLIREVRLRRVFQARIDAASSDTPLGDWHMRSKPHLVLHVVESTYSMGHTDARFPLRWSVEFSSGARTHNYKTPKSAISMAAHRLRRFGVNA